MIKTCPFCGKEFSPKRSNQMYCSKRCCNKANKKRFPESSKVKAKEKITCLLCGKEFQGRRGRKYCSDTCREKAYSRNKTLRNGGTHRDETECLCWTCVHAVPSKKKRAGCDWSRSCGKIPVKGSEYAEKVISPCNNGTHKKQVMKIMTKCPKYERDMGVEYRQ